MTTDFTSLIRTKIASLGLIEKSYQVDIVQDVLSSYIDEKITNIILSASTGTGKSVIAILVSECLSEILNNNLKATILMDKNSLLHQYEDRMISSNLNFVPIKGNKNYICSVLSKEKGKANSCIFYAARKNKELKEELELKGICQDCEYKNSRQKMINADYVLTNYSYFFVSALFSKTLKKRLLTVFDEAHLLNDIFANHMSIYLSQKNLDEIEKDLQFIDSNDVINSCKSYINNLSLFLKIENMSKEQACSIMLFLYNTLAGYFSSAAIESLNVMNFPKYIGLSNLNEKYFGLGCKLDDFVKYNYEHVYDKNDEEMSIKPIFVNNLFEHFTKISTYNLFMSATINKEFFDKTVKLSNTTKFIKAKSVFEKRAKVIKFLNLESLNYTSMNDKKVLKKINEVCLEIVKQNSSDKGIILTPNFKITKHIAKFLDKKKILVYEHEQDEKMELSYKDFKKEKEPCVLISPSIFEGIDLPDETARYEIFIKAPYPSLGDKRIKYICEKHSDIYKTTTLFKMIQGFGRTVRNENDYSVCYCIDKNLHRLFYSNENLWKDEFKVY